MTFSAQEVFKQLGGNKFRMMTGARNFVKGKDYIKFKVPKAKNSIKYIEIKLTAMDDYDVTFKKINGQIVNKVSGVYADGLQDTFTENTGLDTHL